MVVFAPVAITFGAMAAVGLLFYGLWDRIALPLQRIPRVFSDDVERAALKLQSEQIVLAIVAFAVMTWLMIVAVAKPNMLIAIVLLPLLVGITTLCFRAWVRGRAEKRAKAFADQLEMVLRLIGSGLRVGLGLRQALVLVTEDMADPARVEFARTLGETNVGMTLNDALEGLGRRMPSDELRMMIDAIQIQSQTGGNLAKILDHLAATIKGRREIRRKVSVLTGEARAGAWVIGSLPVLVGGFVMLTQSTMRAAMIGTSIGHLGLMLFAVLEGLGAFTLHRLLQFEI